jgi:LemA protein
MEWIVLVALVGVVLAGILIFNRLIRLRNFVREGWSGIDVQLRRRTDLVPNLVDSVKGYAAHERGLFDEVAARRASSLAANNVGGQAAAERELQGALARLLAVAEAYPDLMASKVFHDLQQQLVEIEDQLQMARRYYNGTVRDLNISIQSFPSNIVASLLRIAPAPFFELENRAQAVAPAIGFAEQKK